MIPWPFPVRAAWVILPALIPLGNRKWRHSRRCCFTISDVHGEDAPVTIWIEEGEETDLASVPKMPGVYLWFSDKGEQAAIAHDKLYADKWPREWSDAIFYALLANTVSDLDAYLMWAAVRVGGAAYYADKIPQPTPETERQAP